mgnify:CR=1 FL=1
MDDSMTENTILIEKGWVVTVDDARAVHREGYVFISGDSIQAVGGGSPPADLRQRAKTVIDASRMVVMPGMINAHNHLFQSFLRGLCIDKPLLEWVQGVIWPLAPSFRGEEAYWAAMIGLIENLYSGSTGTIDNQYIHPEHTVDDGIYRAARDTGMRLNLAYGWGDINYFPPLHQTIEEIIAESTRLYETYHGTENGRLRFENGPVIPWGCSEEGMLRVFELARRWGVGSHLHVAETKAEVDINIRDRGSRHIEWLAKLGILGPDVQLVHSVWVDDREMELMAESGSVVVHCPLSNMTMGTAPARVTEMHRMGIDVALASDGSASNNAQDMFEEMRGALMLARTTSVDPMALMPSDVLWMACRGGAKAFGQPDLLGALAPGRKADVVLVDMWRPESVPLHDPLPALVFQHGGRMVNTVIVDGRVLVREGQLTFIDEQEVLREAQKACASLFKRAGLPYEPLPLNK